MTEKRHRAVTKVLTQNPASTTFTLVRSHELWQNYSAYGHLAWLLFQKQTNKKLFLAARKITIKRGLADIKTTERETATFEVELSHPQVVGSWTRNGIQLKQTSHFRMSAKGRVHSLTISNLSTEDTGTFAFCVERLKTSARLVVKGRPETNNDEAITQKHLSSNPNPSGARLRPVLLESFCCELRRAAKRIHSE